MKTLFIFFIISIISVCAQAQSTWRVGDKVMVRTSSMEKWEKATIFLVLTDRTPTMYKANLDVPGTYAITDPLLRGDQVRSRDAKPTIQLPLYSRVDIYYENGTPHTRGSVIEVMAEGRYKVRLDGCSSKWDEVLDWSQVKPAPYIPDTDPNIMAVIGKWAMFTPSYPNTTIVGNDVYRQYGTGGKSPPLQINANGNYIWYYEYNKPPLKGIWVSDAKVPGLTSGVESFNGIIIQDSDKQYYKVYSDKPDHIVAERLCMGTIEMGSRIK